MVKSRTADTASQIKAAIMREYQQYELDVLEKSIAYQFDNKALLIAALTHSGYNGHPFIEHNKR